MFGLFKRDKKEPVEEELAGVHPQRKKLPQTTQPMPIKDPAAAATNKPIAATIKQPTPTKAPDASGLTQEEIDALREDDFAEMGIPFKEVMILENIKKDGKNIIPPVKPQEFKKDVQDIQNKCALYCLPFTPEPYEIFLCLIEFLKQKYRREAAIDSGQHPPPAFNLLQIILWREAERQIKKNENIASDKQLSTVEAEALALKTDKLIKEIWEKAEKKMDRRQAEKRLRREKKLQGGDALSEAEVSAMMNKIKTERREAQARRN